MPASYAHDRFGAMAFATLPQDVKRTVQRFRQLYDVGLHGPDLFFYYQPFFHTRMGALGTKYHRNSGRAFFETAAARLREAPSEGAKAYLFGVLAHFALDSACHPLVCRTAKEGKIGHTELETEFDRHLLTLDGKEPACNQDLGTKMHLTWGECVTVSQFYPPATAYTIRQSVIHMRLVNRVLAMKNRQLLRKGFSLGGEAEMVMTELPNTNCMHLDKVLTELFDGALARYPEMARQLKEHIEKQSPLGADFAVDFG